MAMPFSRTMRSLYADSFYFSLAGLIVAILLLLTWMAWFFMARMTLYETGQLVQAKRTGTIVADFPLAAAEHIRSGQVALAYPQGLGEATGAPLQAVVTEVLPAHEQRVRIELFPHSEITVRHIPPGTVTGRVTVEVAHISPAMLLLRAIQSLQSTLSVATPLRTR